MDLTDQFPLVQLIDGEGKQREKNSHVTVENAKRFYEHMIFSRLFDQKAVNLQRQGRIGTYAPFEGQEASQIGSALALEDGDWMFPTYRDHAATAAFGHSLESIFLYWKGCIEGCVPPPGKHIFPPSVPIASQILHATGTAWAEKKKGSDRVSLVYFGDGATSEGDFHEGLNFASVFQIPVVFLNQNNGFAISVPLERQMNSKTIAQKSLAYDMPGVRVDGNDVFAVYNETMKAVERARSGNGPTLIEAVTWRYGAHTTTDEPSKYRDQNESERRRERDDPITRIERFLKAKDEWDPDWEMKVKTNAEKRLNEAVSEMEKTHKSDEALMFDHVFGTEVWPVQEQKQRFFHEGSEKA
ncbi:pyruvate dehydrogenase (acetyl-transferring) E1 component subunit alpha [Bacillus sp. NTK071]|uniref:pyruvate dehydrogenase (acetyl-transferring) E1 component subunit alpha n=1 Tax=Bacillus sp. NTK071 TaxID=2802175 RepID=UPI001A8FEAD9|nr:pyruvate dehydrogenase (acetyl-transferring) E1 component subunit alpha [Bacillus sp. NTK071]MBN8209226.1 pyruvate dehydrogenase (acetyl-transferring) E1 component subunit alpha [Bacillus sp. NTK071]